jgi:hypothetical protein
MLGPEQPAWRREDVRRAFGEPEDARSLMERDAVVERSAAHRPDEPRGLDGRAVP